MNETLSTLAGFNREDVLETCRRALSGGILAFPCADYSVWYLSDDFLEFPPAADCLRMPLAALCRRVKFSDGTRGVRALVRVLRQHKSLRVGMAAASDRQALVVRSFAELMAEADPDGRLMALWVQVGADRFSRLSTPSMALERMLAEGVATVSPSASDDIFSDEFTEDAPAQALPPNAMSGADLSATLTEVEKERMKEYAGLSVAELLARVVADRRQAGLEG